MELLFANFLRGFVSIIMNMILIFSMLKPKYSKKVTNLLMLGNFTLNLTVSITCYILGDLTLLAKLHIVINTLFFFAIRPFFQDTFMQWLFSCLTVLNVDVVVVVLSYHGCQYLPYPRYANAVLRFVLLGVLILLLRKVLNPVYRQMVEHWGVFFYVAVSIFAAFAYFFMGSEDIVSTLEEQKIPLLFITLIAFAAYASVGHSLKRLGAEFGLREENLRIQKDQELLQLSAETMGQRISLMDEAVRQMSIIQHDQRHVNGTLLELLRQSDTDSAIQLIEQQTKAMPQKPMKYCENIAVNAAVSYYDSLAMQQGISCEIRLDIPGTLPSSDLSLAMVVSNLMENAIHACKQLSPDKKRYIRFTGLYTGQLILEMENPYEGEISMDVNGFPVSEMEGHGRGTESVRSYTKSNGGELVYRMLNGIFKVRLMI